MGLKRRCQICDEYFKGRGLVDYLIEKHGPDHPIICDSCLEANAIICDELRSRGQKLPRGFSEMRRLVRDFRKKGSFSTFSPSALEEMAIPSCPKCGSQVDVNVIKILLKQGLQPGQKVGCECANCLDTFIYTIPSI